MPAILVPLPAPTRFRRVAARIAFLVLPFLMAKLAAAGPRIDTLVEFFPAPSSPTGALLPSPDGNFYGTTTLGGTSNGGTVFRMTAGGSLTTMADLPAVRASFSSGAGSYGAVVRGLDGSFYGTTERGGALRNGTVFRVTPAGALTTLVEFTDDGASNRGSFPYAALVLGADGNFYGTTASGGTSGGGTVFRMTPAGALTTLVDFPGSGTSSAGRAPFSALVQGTDGNFYGTTQGGGSLGGGTVFRVTPAGVLTTLAEFTSGGGFGQGWRLTGALVIGTDGNFYGTTERGGAANAGTVFRLTPAGILTVLGEFTGTAGARPGSRPTAALVEGAGGVFYGTTNQGGAANEGTVFRVAVEGGLTTLASFTGRGGSVPGGRPYAPLVAGADGNFYGTTASSGPRNYGTIFRITPDGVLTTLSDFPPAPGLLLGVGPNGGLVQGADGAFYGTTREGGDGRDGSGGTIFRVTTAGVLTTLVRFSTTLGIAPGDRPQAGLALGPDGSFYGTTTSGGAANRGTIFRVTPAGVLTTLVELTGNVGANLGAFPESALTLGTGGNFYGVTPSGGTADDGTIFRVSPAGSFATIFNFAASDPSGRGNRPIAALALGTDGNFYGSTFYSTIGGSTFFEGTLFRVTPAGALTRLAQFTGTSGATPGDEPVTALVRGGDGNFYGGTSRGGASDFGTLFRLTPGGGFTSLVQFTNDAGANRGVSPDELTPGTDGNFYGVTGSGDTTGFGTIFRLTPAGALTTLVTFTGVGGNAPGSGPCKLLLSNGVDLYGTTASGGKAGVGTIFRLRFEPDGSPTQLLSVAAESGGTRVRWRAVANQVSRVEYSDSMTGPWQPVLGTLTSSGGIIEYLDATQPRPAKRFYRLVTPL